MRRKILGIIVFMLSLSASVVTVTSGQEQIAAVLRVTRQELTLQRANTEAWLPLRQGTEAPFGAGDTLRTTDTGRALLTVADTFDILILPSSTLTLNNLRTGEFSARLESGIAIIHTSAQANIASFALDSAHFTVTMPAPLMAIWSDAERNSSILVAAGSADVQSNAQTFTVEANQGFLAGSSANGIIAELDMPLTAAHLEGELFGCPGVIQTDGLNINVRVAPGLESTVIGNIKNNSEIRLMGMNAFNSWYRIQAFSGFGWVQKALVKTECQDLPTLPRGFSERNPGIRDVLSFELTLLEPFYGSPENDLWFYLSLAPQ